jgi:hypothetical protein
MQFGHHNHDHNYGEHYLVRRPTLDLHPGSARRAYLDIAIPPGTAAGEYRGTIRIAASDGRMLASVPLVIDVLPIRLEEPPVYFAGSYPDRRFMEYGFNTFASSHDQAVALGCKGYLANCGHVPPSFKGKNIGWSGFLSSKDLLRPIIDAGKSGKGPRGFFGGPAPGTHASPKAEAISKEFFDSIRKEFPSIDLFGLTIPAFFHGNYKGFDVPHEWIVLAGRPQPHSPDLLDGARKSGREFWFIDGLRHSKEQAGRFTFGFWLWRTGANGRYTTLAAHLQYGGGTARTTYRWDPYFTLLDVTTCNIDRAIHESAVEGQFNPSRDLVLIRTGIDDYRYIHTLDVWIDRARSRKGAGPVVAEAAKFRDELRGGLSLDLTSYYGARGGSYGENWYTRRDNPWTAARFDQVRRQLAQHILRLQQAVAE